MEENQNKQHVQLPNEMGLDGLDPKDQLIYVIIRSHENEDTHESFPSLKLIAKESGCSIPTVRESIARLVNKKYIESTPRGRKNVYTFSKYVKFEPFSPEFLKNDKISTLAKSYIIASQQYMFKDGEEGRIEYSNYALAKKINMPESSIRKCDGELKRNGYLTVLKNVVYDPISGASNDAKILNLIQVGQAVVGTLMNHEDRLRALEASNERKNELIKRLLNKISPEEAQTFEF